ncbi:CPBP family intramembrane metalloprotease [Ralstonia sp. CHL-2022]|uniref:CPBP family intramembrane metalloprotease n=1 Tax=Ralstonia mojiangensis TaxID=2953895 RepID=A0ABT2LCZ5_9RALS|nr:type II CAAX endopeptidase family protein [Ralstonia mojiangensis]MCT7313276.1 CPBP family intramembrane metalloprotease [Ralstonia mojiangensis]
MVHPERRLRMLLRIFGIIFVAFSAVSSASALTKVETLRSPDLAVAQVQNLERQGYEEMLSAYRQALQESPREASLAIAQCTFIQRFAWAEDSTWSDAASKDFEACQTVLEAQYASDPEASLFPLEHRYGKAAVSYGQLLLARASAWTPAQRARLHAALSKAYGTTQDEQQSGQQAVLAVQLDPRSDRLVTAIRHLAKNGEVGYATKLLGVAPLSQNVWQEAMRIKTALEVLPAAAARDELRRAQMAGLKIDAYTAAKVLRSAGDLAGAQRALNDSTLPRANETSEMRQLRLDVAIGARDSGALADVLLTGLAKAEPMQKLGYAYAHMLVLDPKMIFRGDLLTLLTFPLSYALFLALVPGILCFPTHYRGTVRTRLGKPSVPLFERIGLRHAWFGFAVFIGALLLVPMFRFGVSSDAFIGAGVLSAEQEHQIVKAEIWTLGLSAVGLLWIAARFSWREWLGSRDRVEAWILIGVCVLGLILFLFVRSRLAGPFATPTGMRATWVNAIVMGANAMGGLPLALLLVAVLVPACEEVVFRGCLLGGLSRHISFGWANFWQSALFSAMHWDADHMTFFFVLALLAGWMARRTNGLAAPILLHATNNAFFVLAALR